MNIGRWQVLYWPRLTPFFWAPRGEQCAWGLFTHIYSFIIYIWPIEIRRFKVKEPTEP